MDANGLLLDEEGYPTEATLDEIRTAAPLAALQLAERAWSSYGWASRQLSEPERLVVSRNHCDGEFIRFATGGWSGNESIISALTDNLMVSALCWQLSARGGLHIYEVPPR